MADRAWLTFHEPDGRIRAETVGRIDDFAELVDPNDGSVLHSDVFVMHGMEWRIAKVTLTETLVHIDCVSAVAPSLRDVARVTASLAERELEAGGLTSSS